MTQTAFSDQNGVYLMGMTDAQELRNYITARFTEGELQYAYELLLENAQSLAKAERIPPLQALWKIIDAAYDKKMPPLTCGEGCAHCCYTGVMITKMEWDGMINAARQKGIDLMDVIERSEKSLHRIKKAIESGIDPVKIDWYQMVINQPCPFLDEDESCTIHDDRPLDCRTMVAFRDACGSKKLEHAQRGGLIEEAVAPAVIAKLQYEATPKLKRRKFDGTAPLRLIQHWLLEYKKKKSSRKRKK
ncbi:MAG: YkgJ family cysteine cluster protein [Candidatus Nitronauta litoralis]|uniref:YkgJ family cysteine cluster protein n=1 Tax=Candidatus Nitronauta litoralis TaxID=2705533 RepID=A0A7T0BXF6_9BACT|nr:MAG: YkgJ family cysteine cluster protein [Candidatus Nitronauta litoralis]